MKKFRSRKGMTLVEMVVTVAILSIVGGMGVGIFASTMNNYTTASVTSNEQNNAAIMENYIVSHAKVAKDVKFLPYDLPAGDANQIPCSLLGTYIAHKNGEPDFEVIENYDASPTATDKGIVVEGIESITVELKRHVVDDMGMETDSDFMYMDYFIKMKEGYELQGSVILNNMPLKSLTDRTQPHIQSDPPVTTIGGSSNAAIVFEK